MRVHETRFTEPLTVVHKVGEDLWESSTYPRCSWADSITTDWSAEGQVSKDPIIVAQIPEDQNGTASVGDYLIKGTFDYIGGTRGLMDALPEDARRITSVSDRRGGLSGITGPITRYASVLILECR